MCEGYTDVIGFARAGVPRAVATCGTALTEDHVRSLTRFTRRIVLAYDADEAGPVGGGAGLRLGEGPRRRGCWVVDLPAGSDPDELARSDPERAGRGGRGGPAVPGVPGRTGCWRRRISHAPRARARAAEPRSR